MSVNVIRRSLIGSVFMALAVAMLAGTAFAAHKSDNKFDLADTGVMVGADGSGYSNWDQYEDNWDSEVTVSGLDEGTYTFYAEGPTTKTPVVSFEVDEDGEMTTAREYRHAEPEFATANIRVGDEDPNGTVVLTASGSNDDDDIVEDGEIERFPTDEYDRDRYNDDDGDRDRDDDGGDRDRYDSGSRW